MSAIETNTRKIVKRLEAEGWANDGGSKHAKYEHADKPGVLITVPRHRQIKPGTARSIAKAAGWI